MTRSSPDIAALADEFTKWVEQYALKVCPEGCLPTPGQEREINLFARIVIALRASQPATPTGGDAVAATPADHEDSEELRTLADMIRSMSGRMSLEDDRTTLIMAATQLRRFAGEADAAERTIHLLEANARIQANLLADTGRERDSLLNVAQSEREPPLSDLHAVVEIAGRNEYAPQIDRVKAWLSAMTSTEGK